MAEFMKIESVAMNEDIKANNPATSNVKSSRIFLRSCWKTHCLKVSPERYMEQHLTTILHGEKYYSCKTLNADCDVTKLNQS